MRKLLFICFFCVSYAIANTQRTSTYSKRTHIVLPNKIGNDCIISDDADYNDSIYIDEVLYYKETDDSLRVMGNIMGGKSSLFVILDKKKNSIVFRKQSAKIDSIQCFSCDGHEFMTVNTSYQDMCSRQIYCSLYLLTKDSLKECFGDYKKNEYIGAESYCSDYFVSYNQDFSFDIYRDTLIVNVHKIDENKKADTKKYLVDLK